MSDRKYRHRGYMDSDSGRDQEPRPRPPREGVPGTRSDGGPRGRGLGAPTVVLFKCSACGAEVDTTLTRVDAGSRCPRCAKPLHTCTNCTFFDPSARFECRKPVPARVESKAAGNDCHHYQPKTVRDLRVPTSGPTDPRAAFDALFKKR